MIEENFDVVVVGAGASGVPAAVAAARAGARVALLEKDSALGGTVNKGLGLPVCGFFSSDSDEPLPVNAGLALEFLQTVRTLDSDAVERRGRVFILRCSADRLGKIFRSWIEAETQVKLFTRASGLRIGECNDRITMLEMQSPLEGMVRLCPGEVIDCSGDAVVVQNSSASQIEPTDLPLAGFVLRVRNVELNDMLPIRIPHLLWHAAEARKLPPMARLTVFDPECAGSGILKISVDSGSDLSDALQFSRGIFEELKKELPEFHGSEIVETSTSVLHREGIRLKGEHVLAEDDVRGGRGFPDAAARGCWPMEFWDRKSGPRYSYAKGGATYDIPLQALKSENIGNLWAAGRAISADSKALSSVRVAGTCMAVGEAAGLAAAREAG